MRHKRITSLSHLIALRLRLEQVAKLDKYVLEKRSNRSAVVRAAIDRELEGRK